MPEELTDEEFEGVRNFHLHEISEAGKSVLKMGYPFISKEGIVYLVVESDSGKWIVRIKNPIQITAKGLKKNNG